jgi:hypothetical protein
MLEQLLNSLKTEIGGHLTSQADLSAEQLDDVISSTPDDDPSPLAELFGGSGGGGSLSGISKDLLGGLFGK